MDQPATSPQLRHFLVRTAAQLACALCCYVALAGPAAYYETRGNWVPSPGSKIVGAAYAPLWQALRATPLRQPAEWYRGHCVARAWNKYGPVIFF